MFDKATYNKEYKKRNFKQYRSYSRRWRESELGRKHREREYARYQKTKSNLFEVLGSICKKCGFDDQRALQVDHVNGGGSKDRRKGGNFYLKLLTEIIKGSNDYQLLCANCNWIKRVENNEVRKNQYGEYHG